MKTPDMGVDNQQTAEQEKSIDNNHEKRIKELSEATDIKDFIERLSAIYAILILDSEHYSDRFYDSLGMYQKRGDVPHEAAIAMAQAGIPKDISKEYGQNEVPSAHKTLEHLIEINKKRFPDISPEGWEGIEMIIQGSDGLLTENEDMEKIQKFSDQELKDFLLDASVNGFGRFRGEDDEDYETEK